MNVLTSKTLCDALCMCSQTPKANVGILLKDSRTVNEFVNEITSYMPPQENYYVVQSGIGSSRKNLNFLSGGSISIISAQRQSELRGRCFTTVLYEDGISNDVTGYVREYGEFTSEHLGVFNDGLAQEQQNNSSVENELDEFLDSFKIV